MSISKIICSMPSCSDSNCTYLDYFSSCIVFVSSCKSFIFSSLFSLFDMVIAFFFCFNSCNAVFTPSSFFSNSCSFSSSYKCVHNCALLLYNSVISWIIYSILFVSHVASCSLFVLTSTGVLGASSYGNSVLWLL